MLGNHQLLTRGKPGRPVHPVTHGSDLKVRLMGLEPGDDELDRALLVERMRVLPIMGIDRLALGALRDKAGPRADPLDLAATNRSRDLATRQV